ncbi:MAG: ubiquinol-cytochrome c reductase iron-sulfur subunit [Cyanosarcina radialis HA8281-LM2]|jgi:cytochrome b6-f complex iron-sulfur subunit|nr:ubiquinol-cytochrome c reductase iron-sulfur subunit [Cyanosarcina radialis HA8281-LM2]
MDRRTFLGWIGVGWVASSLPVALAACSENNNASEPTKSTDTGAKSGAASNFTSIGTVAELKQNGQILNEKSPVGPVLVAGNPSNTKELFAVNPTCTHKGCVVEWKADSKDFACPCHGSKFASSGAVTAGPASSPLKTYQVKVEGDSVLVKSSA